MDRALFNSLACADDETVMAKTLAHRLDDACEIHGLEWLVLPFDRTSESWRNGPYWGALVIAEHPRRTSRFARFYKYNEAAQIPENRKPNPDVVYITLQPLGRHEIKRLLLAQIR